MKIFLPGASYSDYKSLIAKTFNGNIKNESCKCYLGNKEQKSSTNSRSKNRTPRKKIVHPMSVPIAMSMLRCRCQEANTKAPIHDEVFCLRTILSCSLE